jgi:glycosyltransferase involved in cell wall biosynthesis
VSVDVVVCAHNEAENIGAVLEAVVRSPAVGQLIVVADACTDATVEIGRGYGATVVTVDAADKGSAMAAGLAGVTTTDVCFIDADLVGLRPGHVSGLCTLAPAGGQLVGLRDERINEVLGFLPPLSGERRLPTAVARSAKLTASGWRAEMLLNVAVVRAGIAHRHVILRGVTNPAKDLGEGGAALAEWGEVAWVSLLYAPELVRYVV